MKKTDEPIAATVLVQDTTMIATGGLTKLEYMCGQVAAAHKPHPEATHRDNAKRIVLRALAILDEIELYERTQEDKR